MSTIDILLVLLLFFGAIGGYRNGFLITISSFIGIILGTVIGLRLMGPVMLFLSTHFEWNEQILPYVAFAIVFLTVILIVNIGARIMKAILYRIFLGGVDKVAGAAVGVVKAAFLLSFVFWIFNALAIGFPERWTDHSVLYPVTARLAPAFTHWVANIFPAVADVFGG